VSKTYKYFSVPTDDMTPDVPRDFEALVDDMWAIPVGFKAQDTGPDNVNAGTGPHNVVEVAHDFPDGTLIYIDASMWVGVMTPVIGYFSIRSKTGGVTTLVSPEFNFQSSPTGVVFPLSTLYVAKGPATVSLTVNMASGNVQTKYRYINVRGLKRG
jgi:hypothetical protein